MENIIEQIERYVCEQNNQVGTCGLGDILKYFANKEGMSQLILKYDGDPEEGITDLDGHVFQFEEILEAIKDTTKFVYLIYCRDYLCLPAMNDRDRMVQFSGTYIEQNEPNYVRVSINQANDIKDYFLPTQRNECERLRISAFSDATLTKEQAEAVGLNKEVYRLITNDQRPVIMFDDWQIAFNACANVRAENVIIYTAVVYNAINDEMLSVALYLYSDGRLTYKVS